MSSSFINSSIDLVRELLVATLTSWDCNSLSDDKILFFSVINLVYSSLIMAVSLASKSADGLSIVISLTPTASRLSKLIYSGIDKLVLF